MKIQSLELFLLQKFKNLPQCFLMHLQIVLTFIKYLVKRQNILERKVDCFQMNSFIFVLLDSHITIIMAFLEALGISGFRSYNPTALQKIEFETPLTLIWGKNGSGKTTIIEVLKYITTGSLPPNSDKGRNFIIEPKMTGNSQVVGDTRLKFKAFNGRPVLAKRRAMLSLTTKGSKFESIEQTLKTKDENGQLLQINHHCAEIQKQIPQLLGISRPVLQNIVFCHQDQSLWPFSESTNLKAIFDQMFETKKFTKILDSFWQQHKQYSKAVKQNKKSLEYLKRIYEQDMKKKRIALRDIEIISDQGFILKELREKMEAVGYRLQNTKDNSQTKFNLIMKRGSLEEKIKAGTNFVVQTNAKIQRLCRQYFETCEFSLENISQSETTEQIESHIEILLRTKEDLQKLYDETKNLKLFNKKQMQIMAQIKRVKQCLPELRNDSNQQEILKKLQNKIDYLDRRKKQGQQLKRQKQKLAPPALLDLSLSQHAYFGQKKEANNIQEQLQSLKGQLLAIYNALYRYVDPKGKSCIYEAGIQTQLKQSQVKLKMKKQQLEKFKNMPQQQSLTERKFKLQFSGIQFHETLYGYCLQKKKCYFCSKTVSDSQLRNIRTKFDKTITKTKQRIKQIDDQIASSGHKETGVNPGHIIPLLEEQINGLERVYQMLSKKCKEYREFKDQMDQNKLNDKLKHYLRKLSITETTSKVALKKQPDLEMFVDIANQYQSLKVKLELKSRDVKQYEQRSRKNREIQGQRSMMQDQQRIIRTRIQTIEEETKSYQILLDIGKRLSALLRSKPKKKNSILSQNQSSSPEDLERQIYGLERQIKLNRIKKQYKISVDATFTKMKDIQQMKKQFSQIDAQLKTIDIKLQEDSKRMSQYNRIKLQYETKKRQSDLKFMMSYQESQRPVEKEYLLKKAEIEDMQTKMKEVEQFCKILENTISSYHREKMDEVNKFLRQIWQQIYHGDDINSVEIQTTFQEDSKRKRSYHYSIVMQKTKGGERRIQMKGRCSMGQKVLASIVIRLALAEVFSKSANILALDQPTTNLDREHIVKLALQLGQLLEINDCKDLQMIIISHDLDFIKLLQKYTDNFYEVSKDQSNFSIITKKNIRQIFQRR